MVLLESDFIRLSIFTQYKVILFQKNWEPKNLASCADFLMVCHAIFPLLGRKDCVMSLEKVCRGGERAWFAVATWYSITGMQYQL